MISKARYQVGPTEDFLKILINPLMILPYTL